MISLFILGGRVVFIEFLGPRIFWGLVISQSINGGLLNLYFLRIRGLVY